MGAPGGAAEERGSFARTALDELHEETGLEADAQDLMPFGSLSEAALHTIAYPSGDVTHCFALLLAVRRWTGTLAPSDEAVELAFFDPSQLPTPLHGPSAITLELYRVFRQSGCFQLR